MFINISAHLLFKKCVHWVGGLKESLKCEYRASSLAVSALMVAFAVVSWELRLPTICVSGSEAVGCAVGVMIALVGVGRTIGAVRIGSLAACTFAQSLQMGR